MTRVVSISPNALERDSRTLKFAHSAARLGYEVSVVESEPSEELRGTALPFELISPRRENDSSDRGETTDRASRGSSSRADRLRGLIPLAIRRILGQPVYYWRRNRQTRALLPDADVYWLHSFWQFPAVYLRARRTGARFLYDTPDSHWEGHDAGDDIASRAISRLYEALERACARRAERFTTVSEGVAGLLEERFGRRPELIRNSHDPRMDRESDRDIRAATGVGQDAFLLVMSGHLKPGTAIEEALAALRVLPDRVHLAFLGLSDAVPPALVEQIGESDRAHLIGPVPADEVVSFIRTADASPILYKAESANYFYALPNGFFHAVSAGLPILFPPLPEIKALCVKHRLGIEIEPSDPASIAAGVEALFQDPSATAAYRANVERAAQTINWEHEEGVIADILGGYASRPSGGHRDAD